MHQQGFVNGRSRKHQAHTRRPSVIGVRLGARARSLNHGRHLPLQTAEQLGSIPPAHEGFRGRQGRWCCERHRINAKSSQATGKVAAGVAGNFRREIHGGGFLRSLAIWLAGWRALAQSQLHWRGSPQRTGGCQRSLGFEARCRIVWADQRDISSGQHDNGGVANR